MKDNIQEILNDLYRIDESFRAHEDELVPLIKKLLSSRPEAGLDQEFVARLRRELLRKADASLPREADNWLNKIMNLNKFAFAAAGAAITLVIAVPVMQMLDNPQATNRIDTAGLDLDTSPRIAKLDNRAFGPLAAMSGANEAPAEGRGAGGGGAADTLAAKEESAAAQAAPGGAGIGAAGESKMIMPGPDHEIVNYEYEYIGDELVLDQAQAGVYRRDADAGAASQAAGSLSSLDLGLFDSDKLRNTRVVSLQIAEDREYGYNVYYNFRDNSISISTNWEQWPFDRGSRGPLSEPDVPADSVLIEMADSFLSQYGISTEGYGQPVVNDYWRRRGIVYDESGSSYVPEVIPVVYPFVLEGQSVYDEGGNPAGLSVEVNIRFDRVQGLHNLFAASYSRSDYAAVTDWTEVREFAERGGQSYLYENPEAERTVVLELGTPEKRLVRQWHYDPSGGKGGGEIFVPALVFPVLNTDEAPNFWRETVIVPLVKEIFDQQNQPHGPDSPRPMPLLRQDAGAAAGQAEDNDSGGDADRMIEPGENEEDTVQE